ncbi:MAG TPA: TetR/AcrR family transcriptional regulator [Anaerolineae bacterium]|nr:TetR/AcrR family transcriptional regulator [Anaerolineae bacterium]
MKKLTTTERRARRIAARKEQILAAASSVFGKKGYQRATTREIAAEADVGEGTIYNYFESKQGLLQAVVEAYAEEVVGAISEVQAEDFEAMMAEVLTHRFQNARERRLMMLFLYEAHIVGGDKNYGQVALGRIIQETQKRVATLVDAGIMRPIDPSFAARTMTATVLGFAMMFELGGELRSGLMRPGFSAGHLGQNVADLFLHGLKADKMVKQEVLDVA